MSNIVAGMTNGRNMMRLLSSHRAAIGTVATSFAGQAALVISGVLVARMLSVSERGQLALLVLIPTAVVQFGSLGFPLAATYYIARDTNCSATVTRLLLPLFLLQIVVLTVIHLLVLWFVFHSQPHYIRVAAMYTALTVPAGLTLQYSLAILQGRQLFRSFNAFRFFPAAMYSLIIVGVFLLHRGDLPTLLLVWGVANIAAAIVAAIAAFHHLPLEHEGAPPPTRGQLFRFGVSSVLGSASPVETFRLDQFAIAFFLSPAALGIYVVGQAFTNLPRFVAQGVGLVAFPQVAAQSDRDDRQRAMGRYTWASLAACGLVVLVIGGAAGWLVPAFFGQDYAGAVPITRILLCGSLFVCVRAVVTDASRGAGAPAMGTAAEIVSWIVLVPALLLLVPRYGIEGAAIASVWSAAASLAALLVFLQPASASAVRAAGERMLPIGRGWRGEDGNPLARIARSVFRDIGLRAGSRTGMIFLVVLAAFAVGSVSPYIARSRHGAPLSVIIALVLALLLLVAFGRQWFRQQVDEPAIAQEQESPSDRADSLAGLSLARLLYFGGTLFIGQLTIRPLLSLTISDWFFFASLSVVIFATTAMRVHAFSQIPKLMIVGASFFLIGGMVSSLSAQHPLQSLAVVLRLVYLLVVWFWLTMVLLQRWRHIVVAVLLWIVSIAANGFASISQLYFGDVIPATDTAWGRMTGFTQHVNDLGGSTSIALIPAAAVALQLSGNRKTRLLSSICFVLIGVGVVLSGSVGAMIAIGLTGVIWLLVSHMRPRDTALLLLGVGATIIVIGIQQDFGASTPFERFAQATGDADDPRATFWSRWETNEAALHRIIRQPIIGAGLDADSMLTETGFSSHNLILGQWYGAGALGALGVSIVLLAVLLKGRDAARYARTQQEVQLAIALTCSFAVFVLFGMSAPVIFNRYGWVSAALLLALYNYVTRTSSVRATSVSHEKRTMAVRGGSSFKPTRGGPRVRGLPRMQTLGTPRIATDQFGDAWRSE